MTEITLTQAQAIIAGALAHARTGGLMSLLVLVLDARAVPKACAAEDGTSRGRYDVAHAKANGALAMGIDSRELARRAREQPHFLASLAACVGGGMALGPGGVLIRDEGDAILGAVGISGDVGDRDDEAAVAGIRSAGLQAAS